MNLVGRKPHLSIEEAARVRSIGKRRVRLEEEIAMLKAELNLLPTQAKLAKEYRVTRSTIRNTTLERHIKHHVLEARAL